MSHSHISNAARVRQLSILVAALVRRAGGEVHLSHAELLAARAPVGMADDGEGGVTIALGDPCEPEAR